MTLAKSGALPSVLQNPVEVPDLATVQSLNREDEQEREEGEKMEGVEFKGQRRRPLVVWCSEGGAVGGAEEGEEVKGRRKKNFTQML